jgi:hypothetical protein
LMTVMGTLVICGRSGCLEIDVDVAEWQGCDGVFASWVHFLQLGIRFQLRASWVIDFNWNHDFTSTSITERQCNRT